MAQQSRGLCPVPFYQENLFPPTGGQISGRFCQTTRTALGNITCCLPCPAIEWTYSDGFMQRTEAASWLNVAAMAATLFCLLSFLVLPVKWTHRHYLSICLAIAVIFMELAFIVPLGSKSQQCYNAITPNNMRSDHTCAISGAFLVFGGWGVVLWVFWRALSLHLQICWEVVPGKAFFYSALAFGWGIPLAGLALALSMTGVSYRFGSTCHINHTNNLQAVWGPLLAFSAGAVVIQGVTFGYCLQVYVRSLLDDHSTSDVSSTLPSYSGSVRTRTARQALQRIKRVIQLQWRGVMVVLVIVAEVIFFAVVFLSMDNTLVATETHPEKLKPWLKCLVTSKGNKNQCLHLAEGLVEDEGTILAVLICLSLSGFWLLLLLGRWSMVQGWVDLFKRHFMRPHEFVSADAKRISLTAHSHAGGSSPYATSHITKYDVLALASPQIHSEVASPQPVFTSPPGSRAGRSSLPGDGNLEKTDYFGREAKYTSPVTSFSSPRPPSANAAYGTYGSVGHDRSHSFTHRSWSLTAASSGGGPGPAWSSSPGHDRTATFSSLGVPKEVREW